MSTDKPPRTTREAMVAEMLGDLTRVLDRIERLTASVAQTEVVVNSALALSSVELRRQLEQIPTQVEGAAKRFSDVAIHQNDEFIGVANEVLSKFMLRTNEIKATLVRLESVTGLKPSDLPRLPVAVQPVAAAPSLPPPLKAVPRPTAVAAPTGRPWWTLPVAFGASFLLGVMLAFGGLLWTGLIQLSSSRLG